MKKLLAVLLVAMIAASVAVVPVSAVEVSDNTIIEACQSYTEDVVEYLQDRGKNSNIKRLFFEYTGDKKPTTQTLVYDIPAVEHVVAEYEVAGKRKYYYVYRPDGEFTNVIPGTTTGNEPTYEVRPLLNYYGTLVYDYETNEVHSIETTLTSEDLSARKELIEDTVIPFFTENNENTPLKVYSLQIDDNTIQNLVEYQTSSGNFCRTVDYNLKTGELELASNSAISIKSYAPAFVSPDSVIYDCSTGTARINEFNGTYLFSSSESETTPTNSESTSPTVSETESPSTNEPSTTTPKNGWVKESSAWYVYRNDQLLKNQWYQDGSKWYYLDDTGAMVTGWKDISDKRYHFDSSGVMQTGWKQIDGSWYYFKGSGEMATGWLQITSGSPWYYLKSDGKMVTGWMQINGKWYCFSNESGSLGAMYANTTTPDGVRVGADGARITNTAAVDKPDTSVDKESSATNSLEERAYRDAGYAIAHFRKQLKNPNSLILRLISSTMYDNGLTAVFAEISGMNSLGGYASDTFIAYVYDGKVYEVYAYNPIQDKVEETRNKKGEHMSLDCDKALTYEP